MSSNVLGAQQTFTAQQRKEHADQLLNLSLQSNDRWFHNTIYDFFFVRLTLRNIASEARKEQILCCTTRSHFEYLCQYAKLLLARSPPPVANTQQELDQIEMPLIYTFFMKNNLHVEASEVLRSLAIESGFVST